MLPSTPNISSPMRNLKKSLCRTDPIPRKFRCEMPKSARKVEPKPLPPSEREFLPIIQSSFYGRKATLSGDKKFSESNSPILNHTANLDTSEIPKRPALKSIQVSSKSHTSEGSVAY